MAVSGEGLAVEIYKNRRILWKPGFTLPILMKMASFPRLIRNALPVHTLPGTTMFRLSVRGRPFQWCRAVGIGEFGGPKAIKGPPSSG